MSTHNPTPTEHLTALRERILARFDREELRTLVFDLGVNYDDLRGETISAKTQALLEHLEKRRRIPDLLTALKERRPNEDEDWDSFIPAEPEARSPYKGLQFFSEDDAPLFFGREQLTAVLLDHLRQHRFLAVVGASGSGKSSVVQAGVLPAVREGAIAADNGSSADWPIHLITPGGEPLKALAVTLTRNSESVTATKTLLADLQADGDSLDLYLYRQLSDQPKGRVLLVVDQFEELFTQCDDANERRLFVKNLVTAVTSGQQGRLTLILTLRADFYAFAVQFESLRPLLETRQKIVGAMSQDELRQAIEGPAEQADWQLQPGLVETMLQDVGREPGALPLLSHALQETWERREGRMMTLVGYQAAGGVRKAIATTANTVYASLSNPQKIIARNIFLRLTELGEGTEDTRRRATLHELLPQGEQVTAIQDVLDVLARKRLVTLNEERSTDDTAQNYAEVAHEALIREWPALREWLDENREGLRIQRQITAIAQEWQAAKDPSYLYRGGRLAQAQEWVAKHGAHLNELENRFLAASQEAVQNEEREREAQRQRELAQVQQLAAEQKKGRDRLRQIVGGLITGLAIVGILALLLYGSNQTAQDNAATAEAARQSSDANAALAQTREADANTQAVAAATAQGQAEKQARLAQAQSLAALSQVAYQNRIYEIELPTLLAIEAYRINQAYDGGVAWLIDNALRPILAPSSFIPILRGHEGRVLSVVFSPNGQTLASSSDDGTIRLWDVRQSTAEPTVLRGHEGDVYSVAFSPDGQTLASGSSDNTIRLWDLSQPDVEPIVLRGHEGDVYSVAFSPNGETLASGGWDNTIRLWDLSQLAADPTVLRGHEAWVYSVVFSPDGQTLASGSSDNTIRLWDESQSTAEPTVFRGHEGSVLSVAFSPDGKTLASSGWDNTIRLWDISQSTAEPTVLRGHEAWVNSVVFSPDGQTLASGSWDTTIRLWEVCQPVAEPIVLHGHEGEVNSVAFSPDGQTLVSSSGDTTIRLWPLLDELVEIACRNIGRNLSWPEWQRYLPGDPYRRTCPNLPVDPTVPPEEQP